MYKVGAPWGLISFLHLSFIVSIAFFFFVINGYLASKLFDCQSLSSDVHCFPFFRLIDFQGGNRKAGLPIAVSIVHQTSHHADKDVSLFWY